MVETLVAEKNQQSVDFSAIIIRRLLLTTKHV